MKVALLGPVAWRTPPRAYGPWELVVSLLTEGLVARGVDVTLFASLDSLTKANLDGVCVRSERLPTRAARKGRTVDVATLAALLAHLKVAYDVRLVAVEEAQAMHAPSQGRKTQGVVSAFTSGRGFGKLEGCLEGGNADQRERRVRDARALGRRFADSLRDRVQ